MVWAEQWSYKIDGVEINDKVNFLVNVPDLENAFGLVDPVMVQIPGDYPVFIRTQPRDATINIQINMTSCSWAVFYSRLTGLRALLSPGPHTLTAQVRGMPDEKSLTIIVIGFDTAPKMRAVNVQAVIPAPVWT
jgi:hypothetical protein